MTTAIPTKKGAALSCGPGRTTLESWLRTDASRRLLGRERDFRFFAPV